MAAKKKTRPCKCIEVANEKLESRGFVVTCAFSLEGKETRAVVDLTKRMDAPRRTKRVTLVATYCPFCGREYNA